MKKLIIFLFIASCFSDEVYIGNDCNIDKTCIDLDYSDLNTSIDIDDPIGEPGMVIEANINAEVYTR